MAMHFTPEDIERFWAKVDKDGPNGCWLWTAATTRRGYGRFRLKPADRPAMHVQSHRASYQITRGEIPDNLFVCHTCDVPQCVNPAHLFLGTPRDNVHDMNAKGRGVSLRGEAHPQAKLTEAVVIELRKGRASGLTRRELSERYGLTPDHITAICGRRLWKHVK